MEGWGLVKKDCQGRAELSDMDMDLDSPSCWLSFSAQFSPRSSSSSPAESISPPLPVSSIRQTSPLSLMEFVLVLLVIYNENAIL